MLLETYHGAYVSVTYAISAEVRRPVLKRTLQASAEFIIEGPRGEACAGSASVRERSYVQNMLFFEHLRLLCNSTFQGPAVHPE